MHRLDKLAKQELADDDYDTARFIYRPLSNLPTPPPSWRDSHAPDARPDDGEPVKSRFLGPAIHLVNLIPASTSLTIASVSRVQAILSRADLPLEEVALAACILDSLDSRFFFRWQFPCCHRFGSDKLDAAAKPHSISPPPLLPQSHIQFQQQQHFHFCNPELIVLASLIIAAKFLEDRQEPTEYYCQTWGRNVWSHEEINMMEWCIMESLDHRIMPLCNENFLADTMMNMTLAAQQPYCNLRQAPALQSVSEDTEAKG